MPKVSNDKHISRKRIKKIKIVQYDQRLWSQHNYISYSVDGGAPIRLAVRGARDTINVSTAIANDHTLVFCKTTESAIGYLEIAGVKGSLKVPKMPARTIEFFGDSQTSGSRANNTLATG